MYSLMKQNQVPPQPITSNLIKYQNLISAKLFSNEVYNEIQHKFTVKTQKINKMGSPSIW